MEQDQLAVHWGLHAGAGTELGVLPRAKVTDAAATRPGMRMALELELEPVLGLEQARELGLGPCLQLRLGLQPGSGQNQRTYTSICTARGHRQRCGKGWCRGGWMEEVQCENGDICNNVNN